jgi:two-component system cell cycle response regulator DivK
MSKILYIEDNFQNFRLVKRMIELDKNGGHEVTQAPDGSSGLELAAELLPDLIFIDINLPDIDGVEVARRLKANAELGHIPLVALTANAMVGDRERYLDAGCDDYLRKPISRNELREVLAKFAGPSPSNGK